jgi:hypothetical protein
MMLHSVKGLMFTSMQIRAMQEALRRACAALAFAFPGGVDAATRARLARHILAGAGGGETDPARLSAAALRALPPLGGSFTPAAARTAAKRPEAPVPSALR